jgi:hypothetical protein
MIVGAQQTSDHMAQLCARYDSGAMPIAVAGMIKDLQPRLLGAKL